MRSFTGLMAAIILLAVFAEVLFLVMRVYSTVMFLFTFPIVAHQTDCLNSGKKSPDATS